jgi:hypothetical protein
VRYEHSKLINYVKKKGSIEALETLKPKGMWWRTFYRLHECAQAAERRADDGFIMAARRLLKMG